MLVVKKADRIPSEVLILRNHFRCSSPIFTILPRTPTFARGIYPKKGMKMNNWNTRRESRESEGVYFYSLQPSSSLPSGQSTVPSHCAFCFLKQISLTHLKVLWLHGMPKNEQKREEFFLPRNRLEGMTLNAVLQGWGSRGIGICLSGQHGRGR